jgi:hydroxymethylbilane synthase
MKSGKRVIVGSRGSKLAVIQCKQVVAELMNANPDLQFDTVSITTAGDRRRSVTLGEFKETGVFVKELEEALLNGSIDMAVHSLKDMPTETTAGLQIAAITQRTDPRDALVSSFSSLAVLPHSSIIGTGSPRRIVQLLSLRPDIEVRLIRGNIDTRLKKVSSSELDGIILAAAALIRLGLESEIAEYLSADVFVPAVGQGALAVEVRSDDTSTLNLVARANHDASRIEVNAERSFLKTLGGGCREPIAALGRVKGDMLHLTGMVANHSSGETMRAELHGSTTQPEEVGHQLAQEMLASGAGSLIERRLA